MSLFICKNISSNFSASYIDSLKILMPSLVRYNLAKVTCSGDWLKMNKCADFFFRKKYTSLTSKF